MTGSAHRSLRRHLIGTLGVALALTLTYGCSSEDDTPPQSEACVVVNCECVVDSDCHPDLMCNPLIGLCSVRSGGGGDEDGGTGNPDAGADAQLDSGGDDTSQPDAPVSDVGADAGLLSFERACSDACATYGRCNDGDANPCEEFCSAMQERIDEIGGTPIGDECGPIWDGTAACVSDISQSCIAVAELFDERTLCTDQLTARPDCFGFDGIDDQDPDPPEGSADPAPDDEQ